MPPRLRQVISAAMLLPIGWLATDLQAQEAARRVAAAELRDVPESLGFANGLLRDRKYELAADEFERFLKADPAPADAADARFGLGRARLFLHQYPEARRQFEEFLRSAPDHPGAPTALFRLGETSYLMGDNASARKALEEYVRKSPDGTHRESAWPELGDACFGLGDMAAARRAYEKALEVDPAGRLAGRTRFHLGRTLAAQGEPDAALKMLNTLVEANDPEWSGRARLQIGQVLAASGHLDDAVAAFAEVERLNPPGASVAEAKLRRGEALLKLDRRDEGEAALAALANDGPRNVALPAAYALAGSLLDRGKPDEAVSASDRAIAQAGDSAWVPRLLFRSAEACVKQGKPDDARSRLLKVAREFPRDAWAPAALVRAARIALDGRDLDAAIALADEFRARFPSHPLRADARLIAGRASWTAGKPKDAIATLSALIDEDKPNAEVSQSAAYYLGLAYRADGQEDKASQVLNNLARMPGASASTDAQLVIAFGHFEAKRYQEAAEALDRYLQARPRGEDAPQALAYLALSRGALDQPEAAQEALGRLEKGWPKSDALPRARLVLAEAALDAKKYDEAAALFRPLVASGEAAWKPRALSGLGWALCQGGHPEEAAATFASLLSTFPDDALAADAALMKGRSLEAANKGDDAVAAFGVVMEKYEKSDRAAPALLARARLLAASGKPLEASDDFARYVQTPPKDGPALDAVLVDYGWALHDARKEAEAEAAFRRVMDEFPESPRSADARLYLAESEFAAGKLSEAVLKLAPLVAEGSKADAETTQAALLRLGRIDLIRGEFGRATNYFDRILNGSPAGKFRDEARLGKAEARLKTGDAPGAEADFAALAAESGPLAPSARLRRVQCLIAMERWADALASADALKADQPKLPQMAELDYARGRSLQMQARFDEARTAYQAAIAAAPGAEVAAMSQWMRGETYLHQKNYTEALREFHKTELSYRSPEWQALALLEAGKIYDQLNRPIDALDVYEKFLANHAMDKHAGDVARRRDAAKKKLALPSEDR